MSDENPFTRESRALKSALGSNVTRGLDPFTSKSALGGLGTTLTSDTFASKRALGGLGATLASDPFASKGAPGGLGGTSNVFAAPQTIHDPTRPGRPSHAPIPGATAPKAAPSVSRQQQESATKVSRAADVGSIVRSARKALALNQQEFADLAGVGRRFVSELESGKSSLEFDKVLRCCAAAGIDILAAPRRLA